MKTRYLLWNIYNIVILLGYDYCNYYYLQYRNRETLSRTFNFERVDIQEYSLLNIIDKVEKITNHKRDLQTIRRCMSIYTNNINLCLKNTELSSTEKIAIY